MAFDQQQPTELAARMQQLRPALAVGTWRPLHSNLGRGHNEPQVWLNDAKPGVQLSQGPVCTPVYITSETMPGWFTKAATLDDAAAFVAKML